MKNYGFISQTLAPLRKDPSHRTEMVSQLFFGDPVFVEQKVLRWYRVTALFDGFSGWLEEKYLYVTGNEEAAVRKAEFILAEPAIARPAITRSELLPLVAGTQLAGWEERNKTFCRGDQKWMLIQGSPIRIPGSPDKRDILKIAESFYGAPFLWGGVSACGFDCAGFVQTVFRIAGICLPRKPNRQAAKGIEIHFMDKARPGDVAFFSKNAFSEITHTGIIAGTNKIIHACGRIRRDTLDQQGIIDNNTGSYSHTLRLIKRFIPDD